MVIIRVKGWTGVDRDCCCFRSACFYLCIVLPISEINNVDVDSCHSLWGSPTKIPLRYRIKRENRFSFL